LFPYCSPGTNRIQLFLTDTDRLNGGRGHGSAVEDHRQHSGSRQIG
jgi:hypothetical protein